MAYLINALPSRIHLGKHTENNVREIRVDCSPWLAQRPELRISAWVTPPGGDAAYPAVTHMEGPELVWPITSSDTAVAGNGMVEFLGTTEAGCRQLSATAWTRINGSTICSTCEPPDPAKPWVDQVLAAADRAEAAADRAENSGGGGGAGGITKETDPTVPAWAKELNKPAYTAEEVGAQPKGDYALKSEIPAPYTLPTASDTVKGGVKIGEGLRMDGDVLNVAGGSEGEYELIETITVEEAAVIERSAEPDGTPYKFDELWIKIVASEGEGISTGFYYHGESSWFLYQYFATGKSENIALNCKKEKGYWIALKCTSGAGANEYLHTSYAGANWLLTAKATGDNAHIRKINSLSAFTVGTKIEIWGVRANA